MTSADTSREIRNAATTIEVPGLGPCDFREFTWADTFAVLDILKPMGITDPDVDWTAMDGSDPAGSMDNMRRMFATATVAIRATYPEATFEAVSRMFIPSNDEDDLLLSRIYAITSTGEDTPTVSDDDDAPSKETAGNGESAEG